MSTFDNGISRRRFSMEVRCGHCSKLFRVADEKITGAGIKFACTKCGEYVKITIEDFQASKTASSAPPAIDVFPSEPPSAQAVSRPADGFAGFEIIEDRESAQQAAVREEPPSFLAAPHEFSEEAASGAPALMMPDVPEAKKAPQKPQTDLQPPAATAGAQRPGSVPNRTLQPAAAPPAKERPAPAPRPAVPAAPSAPAASAAAAAQAGAVHPLVSGSLSGALGGIGCAVPVLLMVLLGAGAVSLLVGSKAADLPIIQSLIMAGSSVIGFGILIGMMIAVLHARSSDGISWFVSMLIGGLLGALFGALMGLVSAAGAGTVFSAAIILASAVGWGIKALLISGAVLLARRVTMSMRTESSSASISGGQLFGIGLAGLVLFLGIFGEVRTAANWKSAMQQGADAVRSQTSVEGLAVTSSIASWDPATGDLLLTVTLENSSESDRTEWYLVADVYDEAGTVLAQVKMLNGKQLYTRRDGAVFAKRNINFRELMMKLRQQGNISIPARGLVSVELRVLEPPAGIASFVAAFQPYDPLQVIREQLEDASQAQ